jgi:two-component system sensor histidine kinase SenX3
MNDSPQPSRARRRPGRRAGRARRADRRLEESLVALLGHELRTPVAGLQNAAELLVHYLDKEIESEMARRIAQRVLRLSTHLGLMIQDLFEMARIAGGAEVPPGVPIDPMDAVRWAVECVESAYGGPPIVVAPQASPLRAVGDARGLGRAIVNLLTNATKHAPESVQIHVRIHATDDAIMIDVEDYGMGIPADEYARIFEPYSRPKRQHGASSDATSRADGLGLGLFIADRIVVAHGGRIDVSSTVGAGTRFTISLPRVSE